MEGQNYCKTPDVVLRSSSSKSFATPNAYSHFPPDRPFTCDHIRIEVSFDFEKKTICGNTSLYLIAIAHEAGILVLDSKSLVIKGVLVNEKTSNFETSATKVKIALQPVPKRGERISVVIDHQAEDPPAGVYFVGPNQQYPNRLRQIWT